MYTIFLGLEYATNIYELHKLEQCAWFADFVVNASNDQLPYSF